MGAGSSVPQFPYSSVEVAPAKGESGSVRRNPAFKDQLQPTAFPEVTTLYQGFQYVCATPAARSRRVCP
jgi:hypothetical protein